MNEQDGNAIETFLHLGKTGGCQAAQSEAISRLIGIALRCGATVDELVEQLNNIKCPNPVWYNGKQILSCADAVAEVLNEQKNSRETEDCKHVTWHQNQQREAGDGANRNDTKIGGEVRIIGEPCPECGETMMMLEGCMTCHYCGYSKCS